MSSTLLDIPNRPPVAIGTLRSGIARQADLVLGIIESVTPQIRQLLTTLEGREIDQIFVTGCGDSFYAALAARYALEKYSGRRVEAIEALEFSRYTVDYLPRGSVVIGISAGGDKTRPNEAVREARKHAAFTIALTGTSTSPIAREAEAALIQNERDFRAAAPAGQGTFAVGNYLASIVVLDLLALELGRADGRLSPSEYDDRLAEMRRASEIIRDTIAATETAVNEFARTVGQASSYQILGGGPSYATALFVSAKLFEMPQVHGVPVELEEWAHEQYFIVRPGTPVLIIVPPGNSVDRAREQMQGAKDMGAVIAAICDPADRATQALADVTFAVQGQVSEEFSPLTYLVPGELFAVGLCEALNRPGFAFISPRQFEVNMRQIKESRMR